MQAREECARPMVQCLHGKRARGRCQAQWPTQCFAQPPPPPPPPPQPAHLLREAVCERLDQLRGGTAAGVAVAALGVAPHVLHPVHLKHLLLSTRAAGAGLRDPVNTAARCLLAASPPWLERRRHPRYHAPRPAHHVLPHAQVGDNNRLADLAQTEGRPAGGAIVQLV